VRFTLNVISCDFQFRLVRFEILLFELVMIQSPIIICIILIYLGKNHIVKDIHNDLYTIPL
jgi:hypothetical protein